MTTKSFFVRNMLFGYDKQLVTARRLARYRRALRGGVEEPVIPPEVKRQQLVERVAREIVENLIISGADTPIVTEIKQQLESQFGIKLFFKYPLTDQDVQIFKESAAGPAEVSAREKADILHQLWRITLDKVDATML